MKKDRASCVQEYLDTLMILRTVQTRMPTRLLQVKKEVNLKHGQQDPPHTHHTPELAVGKPPSVQYNTVGSSDMHMPVLPAAASAYQWRLMQTVQQMMASLAALDVTSLSSVCGAELGAWLDEMSLALTTGVTKFSCKLPSSHTLHRQ